MEYNGGAVLAMVGKDCVAIASDKRYGIQAQTVGFEFEKAFEISPTCYVGLTGLATDIQTMKAKLIFQTNLYRLREEREMGPSVLGNLISTLLYEKRFGPYFTEPVVAGIDKGEPYICAMDLIGAPLFA